MNPFLSLDWGTSSFRLRLVDADTESLLSETAEGRGIAVLWQAWQAAGLPEAERVKFYFEEVKRGIARIGAPAQGAPLLISGMASASIGLRELPYGTLPFELAAPELPVARFDASAGFPHETVLFSGLATENDVMRGEETLLLGLGVIDSAIVLLPGSHSKHARLENGRISGFHTYMTGEIFSLLADRSVLAASVAKGGNPDSAAFRAGVREGLDGNLLNAAFHVRTKRLLEGVSPENNYQFLSGLVIGTECRALSGTDGQLILVAGAPLATAYQVAIGCARGSDDLRIFDPGKAIVQAHAALLKKYC